MATLRAVAQPFDCPLPHTLLAYWRGLLERFRRRGNYGRKVLRLLGEQASWTSFLSHMWADKHLRAKRQCSSDYRLPLCFPTPQFNYASCTNCGYSIFFDARTTGLLHNLDLLE